MKIDYLTAFLIMVAFTYTLAGLAAFFDVPNEIEDWKRAYAEATTIVGVSSAIMVSFRISEQIEKSRKVKEDQDDDP